MGRLAAAIVAAGVALAAAGTAFADKEKVQLTAADQAAAKATVLRLADLGGSGKGWSGGAKTPSPNSSLVCTNFDPKQSDLVLTGDAESAYQHTGLEFDSEVQLLKTKAMVKLDWQREVEQPALMPCLKQEIEKSLPAGERFVSFRRIAFPKVGDESAAFRGVLAVKAGGSTVKVMIDFALVGVDRSEITLITTAPYSAATVVAPAEQRLAQVLAGRAAPHGTA